jgi:hypothetical protein
MEPTLEEIAAAFRKQGQDCERIGSPLYARLLAHAADDIEIEGPVAKLVEGWRGHPVLAALGLRLLGGVHRLVLSGRAPALARHFPSAAGAPDPLTLWDDFLALVETNTGTLRAALDEQVQTNEVRRTAALLPGLLQAAARAQLPVRLLELGSSAGLLLNLDRYRYELGPHGWGDPQAPVVIRTDWDGPAPALDAPLRVLERMGCDPDPIDVRDPERRLRLASFVWPEQQERQALLTAALACAVAHPPPIERAGAGSFLSRRLRPIHAGVATVVMQSVMWWYVPEAERAEVTRTVHEAGARATQAAPLFWLRLEGARPEHADVGLMAFPGGEDTLLGHAHYHGAWVRWGDARG